MAFPWHISNSGDLDVVGLPKPQSVYRTVLWGVKAMGMLVHRPSSNGSFMVPGLPEHLSLWGWPDEIESWSWPGFEGAPMQIRVFARGCETARLLLNGKVLSETTIQANFTALFVIPYSAGNLTSVCVQGTGKHPVSSISLLTEESPAQLQLVSDRTSITHEANDL